MARLNIVALSISTLSSAVEVAMTRTDPTQHLKVNVSFLLSPFTLFSASPKCLCQTYTSRLRLNGDFTNMRSFFFHCRADFYCAFVGSQDLYELSYSASIFYST